MTERLRVEQSDGAGLARDMKKIERALAFADGEPVMIGIYVDDPDAKKGFIEYIQRRYGAEHVVVFTEGFSSVDVANSELIHIFDLDYKEWGPKMNLARDHFVRVRRPKASFPGGNATFILTPPRDFNAPPRSEGRTGSSDAQTNAPDTFDFCSTVLMWPYSSAEVEATLAQGGTS